MRKINKAEQIKASIRAKAEHPFQVIRQRFGYAKVRHRGLAKNTARLMMLFALSNLSGRDQCGSNENQAQAGGLTTDIDFIVQNKTVSCADI